MAVTDDVTRRLADDPCPQAWHAGLPFGLLRECRYARGHRGWHRDESGDLAWGGKLSAEEDAVARALRGDR